MIKNLKTGTNEIIAETASMDLLHLRIGYVYWHHADSFSFYADRFIIRKDERRQYDIPPLYTLGRYLVLPDLYLYEKDL